MHYHHKHTLYTNFKTLHAIFSSDHGRFESLESVCPSWSLLFSLQNLMSFLHKNFFSAKALIYMHVELLCMLQTDKEYLIKLYHVPFIMAGLDINFYTNLPSWASATENSLAHLNFLLALQLFCFFVFFHFRS